MREVEYRRMFNGPGAYEHEELFVRDYFAETVSDVDAMEQLKARVENMKFFNKILKKCKEIYEFHVKEKGNSWKICGIEFLRQKLREKIEAWNTELAFDGAGELSELIDIINYALMLTTRLMS